MKSKKRPANSLIPDYYQSLKNWRKGKFSLSAGIYSMFCIVSKLVIQYGGQHQLKHYYERLGYEVNGEPYNDANIVHYHFIKEIA